MRERSALALLVAALVLVSGARARGGAPEEAARRLAGLGAHPSREQLLAAALALDAAGQRSSAVERYLGLLDAGTGFEAAAKRLATEPSFPLGGVWIDRLRGDELQRLSRGTRQPLERRLGLELLRRGAALEAATRLEQHADPAAAYLAGVAQLHLAAAEQGGARWQRARSCFQRALAGRGEVASLAALALARLEARGAPARAEAHYRSVPAGSPHFFPARQELAWLLLERGDYAGALAESGVLAAPHLRLRVRPDRELLEAAALLGLCRIEAARARLRGGRERLASDAERLRVFLRPRSDVRLYYVEAMASAAGHGATLPARPLGVLLADAGFRRAFGAVRQLQRERAELMRPEAVTLRRLLAAELEARLVLGQRLAGETVHRLLSAQARELAELRRRSEELRFDVEAQGIEALRGAERAAGLTSPAVARQAGRQRWPFSGEYWSDELPFLRARVVSRCPSR
jgi:hypothetical protein